MAVQITFMPIGDAVAKASPAYFFMMDRLLESRMESGHPSNGEFLDEDVNVYLASLLTDMVYRHGEIVRLVVPYDHDLFELACRESDPRVNFRRYRANADYLLASVGIFDHPALERRSSSPRFGLSRESHLGRGAAYYRVAASYALETFRGPTAIGDVMEKLSRGIETYAHVLSVMKGEYLGLFPRLSEGELYHLERSSLEEKRRSEIPAAYDEFLDAYSLVRREGTRDARTRLERAVLRLRELEPAFAFDPGSMKVPPGGDPPRHP